MADTDGSINAMRAQLAGCFVGLLFFRATTIYNNDNQDQ